MTPERNRSPLDGLNAWPGLSSTESQKAVAAARVNAQARREAEAEVSLLFWMTEGNRYVAPDRALFHSQRRMVEFCAECVRMFDAWVELAKKG